MQNEKYKRSSKKRKTERELKNAKGKIEIKF